MMSPRLPIVIAVLVFAALIAQPAAAQSAEDAATRTVVQVGGYPFPPFVDSNAPTGGVTRALIQEMNAVQDRYTFRFRLTSARRRYRDFRRGDIDMMLFEMPSWGWIERDIALKVVRPFLTGGEIYVARAEDADEPEYFQNLERHTIAGHIGYHYRFADMEAEPDRLRQRFDIRLTGSHRKNIRKVLDREADVAVVTESFLRMFLRQHPKLSQRVRIANRPDQRYRMGAIIRPEAPVTAEAVRKILKKLHDRDRLSFVLARFGMADQLIPWWLRGVGNG